MNLTFTPKPILAGGALAALGFTTGTPIQQTL